MKKALPGLVLALSLVLGAAGCGSADIKQAKFESQLRKLIKGKDAITAAQSTCIGNATYKAFDQKAINKLYTAEEEKEIPTAIRDRFEKIVTDCLGPA